VRWLLIDSSAVSHPNCRHKTQAVEVLYWWSNVLRIYFVVFSFVFFCFLYFCFVVFFVFSFVFFTFLCFVVFCFVLLCDNVSALR
jgi:hypothetical protein